MALAREHGVRLGVSGLAGFGLQPTEWDIIHKRLMVINSTVQCFYPDIMHVFTGGVWKKVLDWCLQGKQLLNRECGQRVITSLGSSSVAAITWRIHQSLRIMGHWKRQFLS